MSGGQTKQDRLARLSRPSVVGVSFGPQSSTRSLSMSSTSAAPASGRRDNSDNDSAGSGGSGGSATDPIPRTLPHSRRGSTSSSASGADNPGDSDPRAEDGSGSPNPGKKAGGSGQRGGSDSKATAGTGSRGGTRNPLGTVSEGSVSEWQGAGQGGGAKGKGAKRGRRASTARTSALMPKSSRGDEGISMQAARDEALKAAMAKDQAKKEERQKIQKRIKRRVFFMLWYGKAFTVFQVWALRALMGTVIVSALGIALETMSTGGDFNIEEPVLQSNDPADVDYSRSQPLVDALIILEAIVVVISLAEFSLRLWVCTIPKFYARGYDEMDFWLRWGCCMRACLYGEQTAAMTAGDEAAAKELLSDRRKNVTSPLIELPSVMEGTATPSKGGAAPDLPRELTAAEQKIADKKAETIRKKELRSLRNKSRTMFLLSTSAVLDLLPNLPFLMWAVTGGAVDVFGVGDQNLFAAVCRFLRLLRMCKFARYVDGIRQLTAVTVEKRAEMITGFMLCIMVAIVMSGGVFMVEHSRNTEQFLDFFSAVYFSVITLSTVGYGDKSPITQVGRLLAGVGALAGIGLFTLPSSIITSGFEERQARITERRASGLSKVHIVHRRWELRRALHIWARICKQAGAQERRELRAEAERLVEAETTSFGFGPEAEGPGDAKRGAGGPRDSTVTTRGALLPSPKGKGGRLSVATNMATMSGGGMGRGGLEEQIQAVMTQLKPQRTATEERRLAKAAQLIEACNGDVGECLMILSEVMSGAAASALQVGDARAGTGAESLKLSQ